jgi:hypothetical protein
MTHRTQSKTGFTLEEFEHGEDYLTLELTISYSAQPGEPMVLYDRDGGGYPGCPASLEDVLITVDAAFNDLRSYEGADLANVRAAFDKRYKTDPRLRDTIAEHCWEAAADRDGDTR